MNAGSELKTLEAELQQLAELVHADAKATRSRERVVPIVSVILLSIITLFVTLNYFWFKSELSPDKLAKSLEKELQEVAPSALREFHRLGQDILPVYATELQKQLERSWDDISHRVHDEINQLATHAVARTHDSLLQCQARVLEKTEDAILETYPHLEDPRHREVIAAQLHAVCDAALAKAVGRFDSLYSRDMHDVQDVLLKFDVSDSVEPTIDLQKKFLRLWLQVLEQEIMEL